MTKLKQFPPQLQKGLIEKSVEGTKKKLVDTGVAPELAERYAQAIKDTTDLMMEYGLNFTFTFDQPLPPGQLEKYEAAMRGFMDQHRHSILTLCDIIYQLRCRVSPGAEGGFLKWQEYQRKRLKS